MATRSTTSNSQIILNGVLAQRKSEIDPGAEDSSFFELFTAEQVLKDYDLSYDEIESGLVGGGQDGGIDGIYLLVNGDLVQEESDYSHLKRDVTLDLIIMQSKTSPGFQESPIERFITVSDDIFDLSKDSATFTSVYNEALVEAIRRFRNLYKQLAHYFPALNISFVYACKGADPNDSIKRKVIKLKEAVARHFPEAKCNFSFLGARDLLSLAHREPQRTYSLTLAESPISSAGQVGFVCLVKLRDFFKFITDETESLRRHVFEANVRDYQGSIQVNREIQESLQNPTPEDFWWLNNGVSILATKASLAGKELTVEDPRIVNGLQTSREVYNYCKSRGMDDEERQILIRVIVPPEEESADRIIKATNSQTAVSQASLRATDKIHRDIEEFLWPKGLFYDRRKNYYKNEGKPRDKIIGIPHLAQAVMAIVLQKPDTARARPSSLLKKDEDYSHVFNPDYPVGLYHVCAETMQRVEQHLKSPGSGLARGDRNNLRFHVAMHVIATVTNTTKPTPDEVAGVDVDGLDRATIQSSLDVVKAKYDDLGGNDQVAKGPDLLKAILEDS
ncbi:MAG: AIPR family protein [Truepera sp.]|nr:AIPR family protein [Truepera sp.]